MREFKKDNCKEDCKYCVYVKGPDGIAGFVTTTKIIFAKKTKRDTGMTPFAMVESAVKDYGDIDKAGEIRLMEFYRAVNFVKFLRDYTKFTGEVMNTDEPAFKAIIKEEERKKKELYEEIGR